MDIIGKLTEAITILNEIDEYREQLPEIQSTIDSSLSDLYHYIENNSLNTSQRYKIVGEIQRLRRERRIIKNNNWLSKTYEDNINKLNNKANRSMMIAELNKTTKKVDTQYKNRVLTDELIKELVG